MGMIDRVHGGTPHMGSPAHPAFAARLANPDCHLFGIADLANGGAAENGNTPNLTTGE
jgi:hypothetical protein